MATFLAVFCASGGPLAKAVGILLEKQPLPGDQRSPWEFQKVTFPKIFSLEMPTFLAGFCAPGGPLAKVLGILLEKQPLPGNQRSPWEFQKVTFPKIFSMGMLTFLAGYCAPGGPLAKAVGILLEKQPPPWGPTIVLGISKSYLSKNLQLRDGNISGGFFALLEVL